MNPDKVRIIDFYIGIPICFLLTLWHTLLTSLGFKAKADKQNIKSALFIELSEMGSTVLAAPAIKAFMQQYPDAQVKFLIFEKNRESIDLLNLFPPENVLTIRDNNLVVFTLDVLKHFILKRTSFDVCFDLELFSRCTSILTYLSGAVAKAGFFGYYCEGLYRGHLLTHKISYNPYKHMSLNFMALVQAFLLDNHEDPFDLEEKEQEIKPCRYESDSTLYNAVLAKLKQCSPTFSPSRKIVLINPHPGDLLPIRGWGRDNYQALCQRIIDESDAQIIIIGLSKHHGMGEEICHQINDPRCINFMGQTASLREVLELMTLSTALVSNDSGPPHFAAMTDISILVLFGPETPALYQPISENVKSFFSNVHCSPCLSAFNHRKSVCKNSLCMSKITVTEVMTELKRVLTANE